MINFNNGFIKCRDTDVNLLDVVGKTYFFLLFEFYFDFLIYNNTKSI
jgi:hypothetical protein